MTHPKKLLTCLLFSSLFLSSLFSSVDFEKYGFTRDQKRITDDYTVYSLSDTEGRDVKISLSKEIADERIEQILSIYERFLRWDVISFNTTSFIADESYTSVMVLPSAISYGGVDLLPYVRTGLTFVQHSDELLYDIRIVNAAVNPKLSGTYSSESELLDALYKGVETDLLGELYMGINLGSSRKSTLSDSAADNKVESAEEESAADTSAVPEEEKEETPPPETEESAILPSDDSPSSYTVVKALVIEETSRAIDAASAELKDDLESDLEYEKALLANEIDILSQAVEQDREDQRTAAADLQAKILLLEGSITAMENAIEVGREERKDLEDRITLLTEEIEDLKKAILVIHNTGIFGNIRHIDRKAIEQAIRLKDQDEDITQPEVYESLKSQGYDVSEHAVFLIFALYFNEYY